MRGRRRLRQNSQPSEWIVSIVNLQRAVRDRCAADAMETVTAGNEITLQLFRDSICAVMNCGWRAFQAVNADILRFEDNRPVRRQSSCNQIPDHFMLRIDRDALAAGQFPKIDPGSAPGESQLDSAMLQALPLQPLAHSEFMHQVNGALFKYAGADSFFDVLARMHFEHDGFDAQAL